MKTVANINNTSTKPFRKVEAHQSTPQVEATPKERLHTVEDMKQCCKSVLQWCEAVLQCRKCILQWCEAVLQPCNAQCNGARPIYTTARGFCDGARQNCTEETTNRS